MKKAVYDLLISYAATFAIIFMGAGFLKLAVYLLGISYSYWELFGAVLFMYTIIRLIKIFIAGVKK